MISIYLLTVLASIHGCGLYVYMFNREMVMWQTFLAILLSLIPFVNLCFAFVGYFIWVEVWLSERNFDNKVSRFLNKKIF